MIDLHVNTMIIVINIYYILRKLLTYINIKIISKLPALRQSPAAEERGGEREERGGEREGRGGEREERGGEREERRSRRGREEPM